MTYQIKAKEGTHLPVSIFLFPALVTRLGSGVPLAWMGGRNRTLMVKGAGSQRWDGAGWWARVCVTSARQEDYVLKRCARDDFEGPNQCGMCTTGITV